MSFLLPRKIYLSMTIAVAAVIEFVILSRWSNETPWNGNNDVLYVCNVINIVIALGISVFDTLHYQWIIHQTEAQLKKANSKSEKLLANVFPLAILEKLKNKEETIAERFDSASVFFADIMGFTSLSEKLSPVELVDLLDKLFSLFDGLVIKHNVEKIKTIGDAYMVAAGVPTPIKNHAEQLANFALDFKLCLADFNLKNNQSLRMRIGINSGPIVAGVIGKSRFIYDLWGDCVNTAARMESHGMPEEIHVSEHTYKLLADKFEFENRGIIEIKGKGPMSTFFLRGPMPSVK
jgi:class 3 adenylate cyclase